jgi:hypothetical protein
MTRNGFHNGLLPDLSRDSAADRRKPPKSLLQLIEEDEARRRPQPATPRGPMLVYCNGEWSLPYDVGSVIVKVSPADPNWRDGIEGWIIGGQQDDEA